MTRAVLVTGAGGVGKTTVSAAVAVAAAAAGAETLVITVDPARRLADTFGLGGGPDGIGDDPAPVPGAPRLQAAMLDAASSWRAIIRRHAPPDAAARLLESPFFTAVAERFPSGQAYAAADHMTALADTGRWDLLVVDTPPASGGIDFFTAPSQIRKLVGGRVLRWTTGGRLPGRRALYSLTARPMLRLADTVLGSQLLEDVAEFLLDLRTAYDGLRQRAAVIERRLRAATTLVVTTADPAPLREAIRFFEELPAVASPPAAVVFNRALPVEWARAPHDSGPAPLRENLARWAGEAQRQRDARASFAASRGTTLVSIPWQTEAPTSLEAIAALGTSSPGLAAAVGIG